MSKHERPPALTLPDNIKHLLATALVPSGLPGNNTEKFYLDGYPDLLVRVNVGYKTQDIRQAIKSTAAMWRYGLHALPSALVPHNGEGYVITARVDGEPLKDLLKDGPDSQLIADTDTLLGDLGDWLVGETKKGKSTAMDVFDVHQFMRGTIMQQTASRFWLTDLPTERTEYQGDYSFNVKSLANSIIDAEKLTRSRLTVARLALGRTLDFLPAVAEPGDTTAAIVQLAMATNTSFEF